MPTDKRQRKREGRQARLDAERAAARSAARRRRVITAVAATVVVFAVLLLLSQTGGDDTNDEAATDTTASTATTAATGDAAGFAYGTTPCAPEEPPAEPVRAFDDAFASCLEDGVDYAAEVTTDAGTFTIDLLEDRAPGATNNFVNLARSGFYDGSTFHRVIEDFVIQGGDPVGDPPGTGGPGYEIPDELPAEGEYEIGSVAMANSGPDTGGSQFFVVTGEQGVALPPSYTLFGTVTDGMDVVMAVEATADPAGGDAPPDPATITGVRVLER